MIFPLIGLVRTRRGYGNKDFAIAGLVLGIVAIIAITIVIIVFAATAASVVVTYVEILETFKETYGLL